MTTKRILHIVFFAGVIVMLSGACVLEEDYESPKQDPLCTMEEANLVELQGTLVVNSNGEFVLHAVSDDSLKYTGPIFLFPCATSLKEYIEGTYNAYANIKNIEDNFWITVQGEYRNLEIEDGVEQRFFFNWVAIGADADPTEDA